MLLFVLKSTVNAILQIMGFERVSPAHSSLSLILPKSNMKQNYILVKPCLFTEFLFL